MVTKRCLLLASMLPLVAMAATPDDETVAGFLAQCASRDQAQRQVCELKVTMTAKSLVMNPDGTYCLGAAENALPALTLQRQQSDMVAAWLMAHPEYKDKPQDAAVLEALRASYPCKRQGRR